MSADLWFRRRSALGRWKPPRPTQQTCWTGSMAFQKQDHSLPLTFFHVGHDAVCVQPREPADGQPNETPMINRSTAC